jgi:hypothetical protein
VQSPIKNDFVGVLYTNISSNHSPVEHEFSVKNSQINLIVSQKIMYYLKEFFLLTTKTKIHKTKKISLGLGHFTRKIRGPV